MSFTLSQKLRWLKLPRGFNAQILIDAADEIERLTRERDEARGQRDQRHREAVAQRETLEHLTRERDEARAVLRARRAIR